MSADKDAYRCWKFSNDSLLQSEKGPNVTVQGKRLLTSGENADDLETLDVKPEKTSVGKLI